MTTTKPITTRRTARAAARVHAEHDLYETIRDAGRYAMQSGESVDDAGRQGLGEALWVIQAARQGHEGRDILALGGSLTKHVEGFDTARQGAPAEIGLGWRQ